MNRSYGGRRKKRAGKTVFTIVIWILVFLTLGFAANIGYTLVMEAVYPKEYTGFVETHSDQRGLDPLFVYAVIKCESNFDPDALSSVGAKGLMQLTDDTFDWVKTKAEGGATDTGSVYDPNTNIKYGTLLLALHLQEFGSQELALAAYHAGRGKVNEWLADSAVSGDGESLLHIPYDDTDQYVKRVMKTYDTYKKLYQEK